MIQFFTGLLIYHAFDGRRQHAAGSMMRPQAATQS
jgi:hypothetical protein